MSILNKFKLYKYQSKYQSRYQNKHHKKRKINIFAVLIIFIALAAFAVVQINNNMRPFLEDTSRALANNMTTRIMNEAIINELEENAIDYNDLVILERSESGEVKALRTNITAMNKLKSSLSLTIINKMEQFKAKEIYIPMGNLTENDFFSARGPKLKVKIIPVGYVDMDFENIFTSAGINQTRHQIFIKISSPTTIILPGMKNIYTYPETSVCVAETILIGTVPANYTSIDGYSGSELPGVIKDY